MTIHGVRGSVSEASRHCCRYRQMEDIGSALLLPYAAATLTAPCLYRSPLQQYLAQPASKRNTGSCRTIAGREPSPSRASDTAPPSGFAMLRGVQVWSAAPRLFCQGFH
eukprot:4686674-Amphidinium_carterae.1